MRKFTMIFSLLCAVCFGVNAQVLKVSDAPENGAWAENTTWYFIQNKKGGVVSISNTTGTGEFLSLTNTVIPAVDDENALWCVVGDETNGYQFYNKASGTDKVLYATRELNSGAGSFKMAAKSGAENEYFDIENSQQAGYIIVKDHNNQNNYWNYRDGNLAYWNSTNAKNDDGSSFHFVNAAPAASAKNLLTISGAEITLNATPIDLANNTDKLYSNAACTNTQWGDQFEGHWEYLFDGSYETIFHSEYGDNTSVDGLDHYIRVDMGEGKTIETLQFTIGTRFKNCNVNSPTTIVVEGCNEPNGTYEEIKTVTGIPQQNSYNYTSPVLTNGKAYRYIRYRVTATGTNQTDGGGKVFFFIAEFAMSSVESEFTVNSEYADYTEQIKEVANALENRSGSIMNYVSSIASAFENADRAINANYYALKDKVDELRTYVTYSGEAIGQYNVSADFVAALENAVAVLENPESSTNDYETALATLNALETPAANLTLVDGAFYYIRSVVKENGYVYAKLNDDNLEDDKFERNSLCWASTTTASNQGVWKCEIVEGVAYFKNVHTASYISELITYCPGVLSETEKAPVVLESLGEGQVKIKINGAVMHAQANGYTVPWNDGANSPSAWYIENAAGVLPYTLTVGDAGWSTLILGFDAVIPAEVEAYTVSTVGSDYARLEAATGVLAANTGILVKAAAGDYNFAYTTEAATVTESALEGTLYEKEISGYVLANGDNGIGFYATADGFVNNANKVYLPEQAQGSAAFYGFLFEGTTGVENVEVENGAQVIFDLTGRRIDAINAAGIYIVNGKKVVVK